MDESTAGMLLTDLRYGLGFMRRAVEQIKGGNVRAALDSLSRAEDGLGRVEEGCVRAIEADQLEAEMAEFRGDRWTVAPDGWDEVGPELAEECQACGGIAHPGHTCSRVEDWTIEEILAREG